MLSSGKKNVKHQYHYMYFFTDMTPSSLANKQK